jgi:hypothetical protein
LPPLPSAAGPVRLCGAPIAPPRRPSPPTLPAPAFPSPPSPKVAALSGILLAVGRGGTVERLYTASRLPRAAAAWDTAAAPPPAGGAAGAAEAPKAAAGPEGLGGGALGSGYAAVLALVEADAAWLGGCLPELRGQLLGALALGALAKVGGGPWGGGGPGPRAWPTRTARSRRTSPKRLVVTRFFTLTCSNPAFPGRRGAPPPSHPAALLV